MRLVIKKIFIFLMVFIISIETVFAEDVICEYPDEGLTLTYTGGIGMPSANYAGWSDDSWTVNFLLIKLGEQKYLSNDLEIADTLYQSQGATCPTKIYICEYTELRLGAPNITDVAQWALGLFSLLGGIFSQTLADFSTEMFEAADGLFVDEAKLYIMDRESYDNHKYKQYEGGAYGLSSLDTYTSIYDATEWLTLPVLRQVGGFIASAVGGTLVNAWDATFGDGIYFYYKNFDCTTVLYEGDNATIDINCNAVTTELITYSNIISEYSSCTSQSCKEGKLTELSNQQTKLKALCNNVLSNYTYNEFQKDCINDCLNLAKTLNEKKEGTDLYKEFESKNANCNLSTRLVDWIMKFINWMRYIVPVLLIILSVLDYIKAIAADSEDEIKKVTSKFIKRLIVSVLIFIVPLALEFLLGIFGVDANNFCL